jgi:alanyl-tRNA synthetase
VDVYRDIVNELLSRQALPAGGVAYNPYDTLEVEGPVLALVVNGRSVAAANPGDKVEVMLPETCFYVESGGQVTDTGVIVSAEGKPGWEIRVDGVSHPAAGVIIHSGEVIHGQPGKGDVAIARVDAQRRQDIMRNHTATHLLHAELRSVLGEHARQAGSLVAPDRLRFDFTHPEALTAGQIEKIEAGVNRHILESHPLNITHKPLQQAISEGAMALFGEKYAENVRTITIGEPDAFSYELCGGTHVEDTGDIGIFVITSEGSAAAGIRRIEAVTGRKAYELIQRRFHILKEAAHMLGTASEDVPHKLAALQEEVNAERKQISALRRELALTEFNQRLEEVPLVRDVPVLAMALPQADADTLRQMTDRFRQQYPSSVAVLGSVIDGRPLVIAAVTEDLVKRGLHAGELVKFTAQPLGGSGGGRPTLAQAGGRDAARLTEALASVPGWVEQHLK